MAAIYLFFGLSNMTLELNLNEFEYVNIDYTNNINNCECVCNYVFRKDDFLSFIFVTSILMITNIIFLYKWMNQSVHNKLYFYLISYDIPINLAFKMN